jgi:Photosynthesis system II assembly factor YCF48/Putative zinc-finger
MQKLPHIVRERLKAGRAVTGHLDADILTAFAERSLSEPDRTRVLTHLAACTDCREILSLGLPPIDTGIVAAASISVRRSWFTWPAFRWGFATAGVALIAVGVIELEHHHSATSATLARQVAPAPIVTGSQKEVAPAEPTAELNTTVKAAATAKKAVNAIAEGKVRLDHPAVEPQRRSPNRAEPSSSAVAKLQTQKAPAPMRESQMVEVQAQSAFVNAQPADSQLAQASPPDDSAEQFFGYNSGPLSRAKPADIEPVQAGVGGGIVATPRWSITAVGGLQRSLDQGKTWQDVDVNQSSAVTAGAATETGGLIKSAKVKPNLMHAPMSGNGSLTPIFFRAVTAAGNEVWAGGSNAALFHSTDGGNHWTRVLPSSTDAVLTGDVVSVEFSDPQHGNVTTSTPEIWTTTDAGQTWQKQ